MKSRYSALLIIATEKNNRPVYKLLSQVVDAPGLAANLISIVFERGQCRNSNSLILKLIWQKSVPETSAGYVGRN